MKKILFITGTRADFGKLKPLIKAVAEAGCFEWNIFATGMHMLSRYGLTVDEIYKAGFTKVYAFMNQVYGEPMELVTANTISGLSRYVEENKPDMIVVHGDRVEALAGAIVGALRNILVAHIEGGELSGTIDELIRHSVTKMAHIHFTANETSAHRLLQMGEKPDSVYTIGSPDIDIMLSETLPSLEEVKKHYDISFDDYAIVILHPVTTEPHAQIKHAQSLVEALKESGMNYVIIYPNNDVGCDHIFQAYESLAKDSHYRLFPSLRFEYFLTLLKQARFIIGNSSAGVREAPVYAVPTINIGSRQRSRFNGPTIINVEFDQPKIMQAIKKAHSMTGLKPDMNFGHGNSARSFIDVLQGQQIWNVSKQKHFVDWKEMESR